MKYKVYQQQKSFFNELRKREKSVSIYYRNWQYFLRETTK